LDVEEGGDAGDEAEWAMLARGVVCGAPAPARAVRAVALVEVCHCGLEGAGDYNLAGLVRWGGAIIAPIAARRAALQQPAESEGARTEVALEGTAEIVAVDGSHRLAFPG